jgi:probable rRNA maturation factor
MSRRPKVQISVQAQLSTQVVPFLRSKLRRAKQWMRCPLRDLSVILVGDRRMSQLHKQFMNVSGPTDVLTFPLEHDERGRCVAGEVYVCVPEARRRAKQFDTRVRNELLLYALHGLLHLCGFDDRTEPQYNRMHRMEDRILRRLGVGAVFKPKASP